jgi:hypothetical protein
MIALLRSEPLATAHTTGSSRSALTPGDLLGVQREIVAEHAGGLLGRGAGEDDDVVEDERDVVEEREEARGHRSPTVATSARLASAAAITPARAS